MKRVLLILGFAFACCLPTQAQTQTTVTGTVLTTTGTLATSGYVVFTVKPTSASILYYIAGLNVLVPTGRCGINGSGQIRNTALSGACLVWGNDVITPGNTTYDVQFVPNGVSGQLIHQLLISGPTYSMSAPVFAPQVNINPQYQTINTSPIAVNLVPIADAVFTVGQAGLRYANGYFVNLTVTNSLAYSTLTVTGPLHVTGAVTFDSTLAEAGLATFNAGITGTGNTGALQAGTGILNNNNTWTSNQTFNAGALFNVASTVSFLNGFSATSMVPTAAGTGQVGLTTLPWGQMWVGNDVNMASRLISNATAVRTVTFPNLSGIAALTNVSQTWSGTQTALLSTLHPQVNLCGITSTCANTAQTSTIKIIHGSAPLVSGTPSTVTISGISPAFTSTATYHCTATNQTTAANDNLKIVNTSTSSFTITGPDTLTDVISYICVGN